MRLANRTLTLLLLRTLGWAALLVMTTGLSGAAVVQASAPRQTLTIHAHFCPDGFAETDDLTTCTAPLVGARFLVGPPPDRGTDAYGTVVFDISDQTPGVVTIFQHIANAGFGPRVSCVAGDRPLVIRFVDSFASRPPIQVMAPVQGDVVCDLSYSNNPSFGFDLPVSGGYAVTQTVFAVTCDADPGEIADTDSPSFPPSGCQPEAGVHLSATTGDDVLLGDCITDASGRCPMLMPAAGQVILSAASSTLPAGMRPIANPVLLRATQAHPGIVLIPAGSAGMPSGSGSITVHSRVCPTGYAGTDYDHVCHSTPPTYPQTFFLIGQNGGVDAESARIDANRNVIFADLAGEQFTLIPGMPAAGATTVVFCSPDGAPGTVFPSVTTISAMGTPRTAIDLSAEPAITCDVFAIPGSDR